MSNGADPRVTFCMLNFNRLEETKTNVRRTAPHVDRTVIIDGGSTDGSIEWLNSQECKDLKVECYVHPWEDNPPTQRNKYLDLVTDGWILMLDCDEYLELPALYKLRMIIREAISNGCNGVAFLAHDIQTDLSGGIYDNLSSYYNRQLFQSCPGMKYVGHTHVALVRPALRDACMKTSYQYYHIKTLADSYFRGCRNYWTTSGPAANTTDDPNWQKFKSMVSSRGFKYFHQFADYMRKGNIDNELKQWFIDNREDNNPEVRVWFISYFMFLHPEENIDKLGNKDLAFSPDRKAIELHA
jgi:glycosyltransferase involved in cell wall biosynthesis